MKTMITTKQLLTLTVAASTLVMVGCKKEFDMPPVKDIPVGSVLTVAEVKDFYVPGEEVTITKDYSVYGVITADETTGNLYKEAYMEDNTGGLYLRFTATSGMYIGDSVRINLNGATILKYNNMFQVDGLDPDNNTVKINTQQFRTPTVVTINDIIANDSLYQGRLIQLNHVEFLCSELGQTWADAINQSSEDRTISDTLGAQVIIRSSGYANFANDMLPTGKGSVIAIVSRYNTTTQLIIRDPNELTLFGARKVDCADVAKDFQDQSVTSGGWTTQVVTGPFNWSTSDQGSAGNFYGMMSNWNGTANVASEAWLISPALDFSNSTAPVFDFRNAYNYLGNALEVLVSTNYDGVSAPSTATWNTLSVQLSPGSWTWVSASDAPNGPVDLTPYLTNNVYIAFKYTGGSTNGSTWEIDDIEIFY
ncbi:MAG: choice-of-anchor J domain-containing protein [Flavobacteriales bacterium]|nr:choice-of-anchor J domain-containing protein [Flavobacteriales bacterium]